MTMRSSEIIGTPGPIIGGWKVNALHLLVLCLVVCLVPVPSPLAEIQADVPEQ